MKRSASLLLRSWTLLPPLGAVLLVGCTASETPEVGGESGDGDGDSKATGDGDSGDGDSGDGDESSGDGDGMTDITVDPNMNPDPDPMTDADCAPKPIGLLRDFRSVSSAGDKEYGDEALLNLCPVYGDFEAKCIGGAVPEDLPFIADFCWQLDVPFLGQPEEGIPASTLGPDRKPVVSDPDADFETVRSAETFDAWYRDDPNCNITYEYELPMQENAEGLLVFDSSAFFPLDGLGYQEPEEVGHNFHFTFELHMEFTYRQGDVFSFSGDDDLFVYINDELVIDLGGAHASMDDSVNLDDLGLTPGETYPIDFFHAERAKGESNFHIETSLQFSNCDPIIVR